MTRHRPTTPPRTWRAPMAGWWRRTPAYRRYMLREASALCLAAYALVLLAGLVALARGPAAYAAWRAALATPLSVLLHALALPVVVLHAVTWFQVLPKTLPALPAPWTPVRITAAAPALSAVLSLALLGWVVWAGSLGA